jgi:ribonuclease R
MLPERLSNGLCSLRPGEDRLVFACEADLTPGGEVFRHRFFPAVINSAARLTYHQVEDHLVKGLAVKAVPAAVRPSLALLARVARSLMAGRRRAGSLDFDLPEPDITLDLTGQVENIARSERLFAHRLVEECMLLANRLAAGILLAAGAEGVYRVHEAPAPDRVEELAHLLAPLGFVPPKTGPGGRMASPVFFQRILDAAAGTPRERFLNTVVLRSMKRALYTSRPLGHFGLALAHYTHFTSPIRRYADLLVHRMLRGTARLDRPVPGRPDKIAARGKDEAAPALEAVCAHISATELAADEAERELLAVLRARFMEDKLGEEFTGVVSGVTAFGFFVELSDFFVDGLVRLSSLGDDYYVFRERELSLVGEHSGRVFRLGDLVRVRVARVDVVRRHLDFELREKIG